MTTYYLPKFAQQYKKMPIEVQEEADRKEKMFHKNPFDRRLKTHKLGGLLNSFWAFSVTRTHRIIFDFAEKGRVRFYQIGPHDIYK